MAARAMEADAYHRLLAAMSPGSPAHSLVLHHQRSPSECYSLAMRALEEAYGDLVRMATDLVGPVPLSKRPSEVVQDLKDFLGMKETLLKAGVDIADVLAQQKVLAMLPPSYNAAEAWPKWVESASHQPSPSPPEARGEVLKSLKAPS
ncbi:Hypothetical protein FKW44_020358 [Caligus rogercresseyi]|uniref:Uncharacterized protein n=1 Tax=Caligus rogercresseyi TaxID=217165 RepID=A0A7T8GX65_CALRO|nr:Hypothetical protein FKW44_020358 [Caligus rogercresseyi]